MNPNLIIKTALTIGLGIVCFLNLSWVIAGIEKINDPRVKSETAIEVTFERIE